jgi:hypothetical protein
MAEPAIRNSSSNPSFRLYEGYSFTNSDQDIVQHLDFLLSFVSRMFIPHQSTPEQPPSHQIEYSKKILKHVIPNFALCTPDIKKKILELLKLLHTSEQKFDAKTSEDFRNILEVFHSDEINIFAQKELGNAFLAGSYTEKSQFTLAVEITAVALTQVFSKLSLSTKKEILNNIDTAFARKIDFLPAEKQDQLNRMREVYNQVDWSNMQASVFEEIKRQKETEAQAKNLRKETNPAQHVRKDSDNSKNDDPLALMRLDKITQPFHGMVEQYLPDILIAKSDTTMKEFLRSKVPDFDKLLKPLMAKCCFKEPSQVSRVEQQTMNSIFDQLTVFFNMIVKTIDENKSIADLANDDQKNFLKQLLLRRALGIPIEKASAVKEDDCKVLLHEALFQELQGLYGLMLQADPKGPVFDALTEMGQFAFAMLSLIILKRIVTPYTIALIIERFIDDTIDFSITKDSNPNPVNLNEADVIFAKALGEKIQNLAKSVLTLGDPQSLMRPIVFGVGKIIDLKQASIGQSIMKLLKELKGSKCTLTPFLVIEHLFFQRNGDKLQAVMLPEHLPTQETIDATTKRVGLKIEKDIFPKIEKMLKDAPQPKEAVAQQAEGKNEIKDVGGFWNMLADKAVKKTTELVLSSDMIRKYLENLNHRLWILTQDEDIIEIIILHLIRGLRKGVEAGIHPEPKV